MFKKRVGITQRVMKHPRYNEMIDCLDINWAKFLISIDILPVPLSLAPASSAEDIWQTLELDGLILSGGNTLVEYADATDKPENLSAERDAYEQAENSSIAFQCPSEVNSFHDCAVSRAKLGKELIPLAHDAEDNIEAFCHLKDKVLGIMWHPERENPPLQLDCELIKRHFGL